MKKIKYLMPILGLSCVATTAMPLTCCSGDQQGSIKPTINVSHGSVKYTTITLNNSFTITYTPETGYELSSVSITIGDNSLTQGTDYTISGNVITVKASAVTSDKIVITISANKTSSGIKPTINVSHGGVTYTTISLNNSFTITYTPETDYEITSVSITIGGKSLTQGTDYTINGNVITVKASAVTSSSIVITIGASKTSSSSIKPTINVSHGSISYSTISLNNSFTITYTPDYGYEMSSVSISIGGTKLDGDEDYTISGNVITVKASAVTSDVIVITITANQTSTGSTITINSSTTLTSGSYKSSSADENAVLVDGKNITAKLSNITLNKTGDCSDTEESSFYGTNSALLAKGGSNVVLSKLNVTTNAKGANGVFAYGGTSSTESGKTGDGTNITISDSTINTSQGNSGGIMVAGHGSLSATNCTVTTQGNSSAAIRSDRGGDTMAITGGTYTSNGKGSPAIYATATIDVTNANLISNHSEGVIVEGSNDVTLTGCTLEDTNDQHNSTHSSEYKNIFLYQSMSGDAGKGGDSFTATNCTIKTHQGDDIYVTNQTSEINLNSSTFTNDWTGTKYFLRCQADGWGTTGKNGGHATLNANKQTINGNIDIDSISTLKLNLTNTSAWTGALTNANKSTAGVVVTIDSTSSWSLTADSYVGTIDTTSLARVTTNGHKLYGWNGSTWEQIK